ncbi:MAG TPA: MFS transporter [Planktothrix sp.]|jgi:MFS family permease
MQSDAEAMTSQSVSTFMKFIAILYLVEGWAQVTGIMHLPLNYFCKEVLHWGPAAIGVYLGVLGIPWVIKPLYGLVSDAFPLLGYRRKSYLIVLNALAVCSFAGMAVAVAPGKIIIALTVITVAMAASSALCGGLLVEKAHSSGLSTKFCSQQTLWVNIASVTAAVIGGFLCQSLSAKGALHVGSLLTMMAPLAAALASWGLISEQRVQIGKSHFQAVGQGLKAAVQSRVVWLVGLFLVLYAFNPGFGTPLYFHMVDHLHFTPKFIGYLGAWYALGSAGGALLFRKLSQHIRMNVFVVLLIITGAAVQWSFIWMTTEPTAIVLNILNGCMTAAAALSVHVLAANKCPSGAEGFVYSLLISLTNAAYFGSQTLGGFLYADHYHGEINGLIKLSAELTLMCLVLVPFVNFEKEPGPTWFQLACARFGRS